MNALLDDRLGRYFHQQLRLLRDDAAQFADDHPAVARELGLARGQSRDPQVEMLLQSFAYLTGRLNFRLDEERGLLPNLLLGLLYPHLQAPIPPMAVAHIDVKPDGANFAEGWTLKRDRQLVATTLAPGGAELQCRFRAIYDTPLLPLRVTGVELAPANQFDLRGSHRAVQSVLRLRIHRTGNHDIKTLKLGRLRLHLQGDGPQAFVLYDLLSQHLSGVAVRGAADAPMQLLGPDAVRWLGHAEDEAALPAPANTHPGFRLLQEYFAFREKFLFFDLDGVDANRVGSSDELQLLFLLDQPCPEHLRLHPHSLRLNCVPVVNLYTQRLEPLRLDQRSYEYRLSGDSARHRYCEIHSVLELAAVQGDGSERELAPYFAAAQYQRIAEHDYFYLPRRALSTAPSVPGTELHVSFLDLDLALDRPPGDTIVGRVLCTNRRLAEQFGPSDAIELEGAGPVNHIHLLGRPSQHRAPSVLGNAPWALLAQLAPCFLSLSEHADALGALKRMLSLHCHADLPANRREIDAIEALQCRPSVRRLFTAGERAWGGLVRGLDVRLLLNEEAFSAGSSLLFGEVLQRFLALYAAANSYTALSLVSTTQGVRKQWPPMAGARLVL